MCQIEDKILLDKLILQPLKNKAKKCMMFGLMFRCNKKKELLTTKLTQLEK